MGTEICFKGYLRSLVKGYEQWQRSYTLTDASFGLMVQTVLPEKDREFGDDRQPEQEEKIERLPVLAGICKYAAEHVLLVGRPGAGKSTALQKLLLDEAHKGLAEEHILIPVLVELRSWQTLPSVVDLIKAFLRKHTLRLSTEEIDDLLFEGRFLLLMDGVNELPSRGRQDLITFRETNPATPMIFTTRILGVGGNLGIEKQLEMLPLSERQMRHFIEMRLPEQGNQMLQSLGDRLRKFGETPLLLSMLCDVFQQKGRIPENLGSAFRDFANLYDKKTKEHVEEELRSWWSELLQQLAFAMMPQGQPDGLRLSITRVEAEDILTKFLDAEKFDKPRDHAKQRLDNLLKHHLIQVKLIGTEEEVEFRHQLIQEYYAAEYVGRSLPKLLENKLKFQKDYLNYLNWTESLALMLELVKIDEQALDVVGLALEVDVQLGARLVGAVKPRLQEKTVHLLIQVMDALKIPQLTAIKLLGTTQSAEVVEYLIQTLQNQDLFVRREAAEALGKIGDSKAVDPLIIALKDEEAIMRSFAAKALGDIGNDKAVEPLILALKDKESSVRLFVVIALGDIGNDKAIEPLILVLRDEDSSVFYAAIAVLRNIGSEKNIRYLNQFLQAQFLQDKDPHMRFRVAIVLENIEVRKVIKSFIQPLIHKNSSASSKLMEMSVNFRERRIKLLVKYLEDGDFAARWYAEKELIDIAKAEINLSSLVEQLPTLSSLISTKSSQDTISIITAIQARCKYYNHAIFQTPLPKSETTDAENTPVTMIFNAEVKTAIGVLKGNFNNNSPQSKPS